MKPSLYQPDDAAQTPYLFFTGKGGVGKTSTACATAVALADRGEHILIVSTDPASNLQDVFGIDLDGTPRLVPGVSGLDAVNLDPLAAAAAYRESVVAPYRGVLPDAAVANMEEQLSGSCTVEIASFQAFAEFLTDEATREHYDHVIFDTAPTGHTLRLLELPSAWSGFIETSSHGASCLGQLAGLGEKKAMYEKAVVTLGDAVATTLVLVTRPASVPLAEAARASHELAQLGMKRQLLVINGVLESSDGELATGIVQKQRAALAAMPDTLRTLPQRVVPLRAYGITGLAHIRAMLASSQPEADEAPVVQDASSAADDAKNLSDIADDIEAQHRRVIFTMGKGGVGKTTIAVALALLLTARGHDVLLTTTDPADHLRLALGGDNAAVEKAGGRLRVRHIDAAKELARYQQEVIAKAEANGITGDNLDYIKEDLRSPCTQEIAVFRAFADIVADADKEIVVVDTAPTGHTLLLLESTASYDREIRRTKGETPASVRTLLPRLKGPETETLIVTLPETTPIAEALRLEDDLYRAGLPARWWIVNQSLAKAAPQDPLLRAKAQEEAVETQRVARHTQGRYAVIAWKEDGLKQYLERI